MHFDELKLIIGNDFANGEFKKSLFERFGTILFSSIQVRNVPFANIGEDGASAEETIDQEKGGSGVSNSLIRIPNSLGGSATIFTRVRKTSSR